MAEDHAGLLRVLAQLQLWAPTDTTRATLVSALGYVRATLRDATTEFYAGSQDADEAYFALDGDARAMRDAPFVDRRSYSNWTAALAGMSCLASVALDDSELAAEAAQTLDALHEHMRDADGLLYHVYSIDGQARVRGMLGDQVAYVRALLDAHETGGEARFLSRACAHADATIAHFGASDGGFYDHAAIEAQLGRLTLRDRPIVDNGLFAESLLRLSAVTGNGAYRTEAERALALYAPTFANAGSFAAAYVRAAQRDFATEVVVKLVGSCPETADLRAAAWHLPSAFVALRTIAAADAGSIDLPGTPAPAAYLCVGTRCSSPARSPNALRASFDALDETPSGARA